MDWNEILMTIITAVVIPLLGIGVKLLADYLMVKQAEVLNLIDQDWRYALKEAARLAVAAAEQSGIAGLIDGVYKNKKAYALELADKFLRQYSIDVDLDVLAGLIEAEVLRQFPQQEATAGFGADLANPAL